QRGELQRRRSRPIAAGEIDDRAAHPGGARRGDGRSTLERAGALQRTGSLQRAGSLEWARTLKRAIALQGPIALKWAAALQRARALQRSATLLRVVALQRTTTLERPGILGRTSVLPVAILVLLLTRTALGKRRRSAHQCHRCGQTLRRKCNFMHQAHLVPPGISRHVPSES